jgi:ABC-type antimicrobial peptide transport system permease subunit
MVYVPYRQQSSASMVLLVRLGQGSTGVPQALDEIVRDIDIGVHADANVPYRDLMGLALLPGRAAAIFCTVVGVVGLIMASLGLYGVLAYMVVQRAREIGIRMALGADPRRVRGLVLHHALRLTGMGLAIGLALAVIAMQALRGLLYGISPSDPITFGGIAVLLLTVALAAGFLPALRATATDPISVLQSD